MGELLRAEEVVDRHPDELRNELAEVRARQPQPGGELVGTRGCARAVAGVQVQIGGAVEQPSGGVFGKAAWLFRSPWHPIQRDAATAGDESVFG